MSYAALHEFVKFLRHHLASSLSQWSRYLLILYSRSRYNCSVRKDALFAAKPKRIFDERNNPLGSWKNFKKKNVKNAWSRRVAGLTFRLAGGEIQGKRRKTPQGFLQTQAQLCQYSSKQHNTFLCWTCLFELSFTTCLKHLVHIAWPSSELRIIRQTLPFVQAL